MPTMAVEMKTTPPPESVVYRLARGPEHPFTLPNWDRADTDGTFGNRFDDPGGMAGIPPEERYRVLYCASQREAAFAEVLGRFRQKPDIVQALERIDDHEEAVVDALRGAVDPEFIDHPLLESNWLQRRRMATSIVNSHSNYVDISHADTLDHLNKVLEPLLESLGLNEVDLSSITSPRERFLTQYAARYIYQSGFAGIRYTSRLGANWECWALFEGRFSHRQSYPGPSENIYANDPDLLSVASRYGFTIEVIQGMDHYLRPWKDES